MPTVIDSLIVSLSLDGKGFEQGAAKADAATKKLQDGAIAMAEAAQKAGEEAAEAAQKAAQAQQDYAKATGDAARDAAKQAMDIAKADTAAASLTAAQKKKAAQDAAGVLGKHAIEQEKQQKKVRDEDAKTSKAIQEQGKAAAETYTKVRNEVASLFATFVAARGLEQFVSQTTQAEDATAKLARTLGVSANDMSALGIAAAQAGGTSEGAQGSMAGMVRAFADFSKGLGGADVAAAAKQLSGVQGGVDIFVDATGKLRGPLDQFKAAIYDLKRLNDTQGGAAAEQFGKKMGFDQTTIDLAIQAGDKFGGLIEQNRQYAETSEDVAAAQSRIAGLALVQAQATRAGETLLTAATPALLDLMSSVGGLLKQLDDYEKTPAFAADMKVYAEDAKELGADIKYVATTINDAVKSTVGWKFVIEGLIGLKLAGWILGLVGPLASVVGLATRAGTALGLLRAVAPAAAGTSVLPVIAAAAGLTVLGREAAQGTGDDAQTTVDAIAEGSGANQGKRKLGPIEMAMLSVRNAILRARGYKEEHTHQGNSDGTPEGDREAADLLAKRQSEHAVELREYLSQRATERAARAAEAKPGERSWSQWYYGDEAAAEEDKKIGAEAAATTTSPADGQEAKAKLAIAADVDATGVKADASKAAKSATAGEAAPVIIRGDEPQTLREILAGILRAATGIDLLNSSGLGTAGSPAQGGVASAVNGARLPSMSLQPEGHAATDISKSGKTAYLMDFFQKSGWSKEQAAGIVANVTTESALRPDAVGDGGKAYGIGQWHPDRQAKFKELFGKDIKGSSLGEQAAFYDWELKNTEKNAGNALRKAQGAYESGAIVSSQDERPADRAGNERMRGALAERIAAAGSGSTFAQLQEASAQASAALKQLGPRAISPTITAAAKAGAAASSAVTQIASSTANDNSVSNETHVHGPITVQAQTDKAAQASLGQHLQGYNDLASSANTAVA